MRSYFHSSAAARPAAARRTGSRYSETSASRLPLSRTRAEHAAIAKASAEWEREVVRGLEAFVGKAIPLSGGENLRITHVVNLAEDETFAGWYNWRGVTNPDVVLIGVLVGGPENGAQAAIAVDAKLSARSRKTQILTETLALLLEPFQPLSNHVDGLMGEGTSGRLVLRTGFHVVRGVETTVGTTNKATRSLLDPEFAAEFIAAQPVSLRPRREEPARQRAPRPRRVTPAPVATAEIAQQVPLLRETVWGLDRLCAAGCAMPWSKGVYTMTDVLALDHMEGTPVDCVIVGMHGEEHVAQGVVLGAKRTMPTEEEMKAILAILPAPMSGTTYRIATPFRVVPGKAETLAVLGNRRTVALASSTAHPAYNDAAAGGT